MNKTNNNPGIRDNIGQICVNMETLTAMLDCGRPTAESIARLSGAKFKIGKRALYNVDKIRNYINSCGEEINV